jgi:type IV secretion system protein VirB9
MKRITLALTIFICFFVAIKADASQLPRYLGKEKKFRMFIYNPYDVYRYVGNYNYHGFIEFQGSVSKKNDPDAVSDASAASVPQAEEVTEVAIGNSDAWLWKISDSKNRLYLKPVGDSANTNMTVKTSLGRVYNFELLARTASGTDDPNLIFAVKFVYPDDTDKNILEFPKAPVSDVPDMHNLSLYNFNYDFTGEPTIAPLKVFDNGEFTYLQFANKSAELPAIFAVDSDGFESLVNFRVAGDYIVIERVASQFTLRNGSDIVCVYNNTLFKSGKMIPKDKKNDSSSNPITNFNKR